MRPNQDQIFSTLEGNNWFRRNKSALDQFDARVDLPIKLIELYGLQPRNVLEVGAANGVRLSEISEHYGCKRLVAVEPSVEAILDGESRFPNIRFVRGTADAIPLQEPFDLIIINFVFHWIDRSSLLRSVSEIDRLLVDGGYLIIGDFYPSNWTKVRYHHLPEQEVFTYKQNYGAIFLASGLYHSVCLFTGAHSSKALQGEIPEDERTGVWLLRKSLTEHYVEASLRR